MRYFLIFAVVVLVGLGIWIVKAPQKNAAAGEAPAAAVAAPGGPSGTAADADVFSKTPPDTILFESPKEGNVTFTHKQHYERVKGDCSVCHNKVFPQSRAPINYKKALHRVAEADRTSCAYCHAVGGSAFAADSNCTKCHMKDFPVH